MPCGDHTGPLGLGPRTGRCFSRHHGFGKRIYSESNFSMRNNCRGLGIGRLYDLLENDFNLLNNYDDINKKRLLKTLNNYLNHLKNLQSKIEEKIKDLENTDK